MLILAVRAHDHVGRLEQLHLWVHQASIHMVLIALEVAEANVIHLSQIADRFPQASDAIAVASLYVELLDDLVEGAQDLHISELSVAIQVLILELLLRALVLPQQVLHGETHTADLFSNELLVLAGDDVAVEEVLRDWIEPFFDGAIDDLLLHPLLILRVDPEGQAQVQCIVHMHHRILSKLQLADEPF